MRETNKKAMRNNLKNKQAMISVFSYFPLNSRIFLTNSISTPISSETFLILSSPPSFPSSRLLQLLASIPFLVPGETGSLTGRASIHSRLLPEGDRICFALYFRGEIKGGESKVFLTLSKVGERK